MYKSRMPYIGMPVKCKHPGWESKIGAICAINGDKVMVEFGKHDFVEFYSDELVLLCMTMILCNSIIKDGPLYMTGIVLTSAMFILSVILAVITGMELHEKC